MLLKVVFALTLYKLATSELVSQLPPNSHLPNSDGFSCADTNSPGNHLFIKYDRSCVASGDLKTILFDAISRCNKCEIFK
jgi:hypothetical protein